MRRIIFCLLIIPGCFVMGCRSSAEDSCKETSETPQAVEQRDYAYVKMGGLSTGQKAWLLSLQGLVNRSGPNLYVLQEGNETHTRWMEWYKKYNLVGKEVAFAELVAERSKEAKGFIVYDPEVPASLNVALSMAGYLDCVVCSPSEKQELEELGLKCVDDFQGKWKDKLEAYRWAIDKAMDKCDCSVLANYEQRASASVRPTADYLVNKRGFCMGLCVNEADYPKEAELWDEVQKAAPDHAIMMGWHTSRDTEATHVYFGSRHNVWVYCAGAFNMSFHQHVGNRQPFEQDHCEQAKCDPEGRYVTITLSDGDSWHSMVDMQKKFWLHPRRGEVPLGWEVAPIFSRIAPAVFEYYYATRSENDYLVCGPSGAGYNYLSGVADWKGYLRHTEELMKQSSLKTIWVINRVVRHLPGGVIEHRLKDGPIPYSKKQMEEMGGIKDEKGADWVDREMVLRYMQGIPDALGFFQGWERIPGEQTIWVGDKAWAPTVALVRREVDEVLKEIDDAAADEPRPAFLATHVNCYRADMEVLIETVEKLRAKGYTVVRPDEFLRLAQDAHARDLRQ